MRRMASWSCSTCAAQATWGGKGVAPDSGCVDTQQPRLSAPCSLGFACRGCAAVILLPLEWCLSQERPCQEPSPPLAEQMLCHQCDIHTAYPSHTTDTTYASITNSPSIQTIRFLQTSLTNDNPISCHPYHPYHPYHP
eukprot:362559-Chlamydomonas_euryale.AAC.5